MKKNKKIEILSSKIKLLQMENEELKKNDSKDMANQQLLSLEASIKEYEKLSGECRDIKEAYTRSVKEMHKLISKYKKDIRHTKIKQMIGGIRKIFP